MKNLKFKIFLLFLFSCLLPYNLSLAQNPNKIKRHINQFEVDTCFLRELKLLKLEEVKRDYDSSSVWIIYISKEEKKSYFISITVVPEVFYFDNSKILAYFYLDESLYLVLGDIINDFFSYNNQKEELEFSVAPDITYIDTLTNTLLDIPISIHYPTWIYYFENGVLHH